MAIFRQFSLIDRIESSPTRILSNWVMQRHWPFLISSTRLFAAAVTSHDKDFPSRSVLAARLAFTSLLSLHRTCATSCATASSSRSSVLIHHRTMSSPSRWGTVATSASSMNVSLFGRYVSAGLSGSIPRGVTKYFQSAERTSTQVHSPSSSARYFVRTLLKTAISARHLVRV
jgi:hypothetical protein